MHIPVLKNKVIEYLDPKPNENFIDATLGEGGHTLAILERNGPKGKVLGIEWDPHLYKNLLESEIERLILVNDSFVNLKKIVEREKFRNISGILFDLGISSWHLEESGRGFSFLKNELLIMRYDWESKESSLLPINRVPFKKLIAAEILNQWPEKEIERILRECGQEKFAKRIAKEIVEERKRKPIKTTFQLVKVVKKATPSWYRHRKIHPATKTFQALRITVNDELNNLKIALSQALEVLEKGGRLAIISFHSLEDRIIKNFFRDWQKEKKIKILTKKPVRPSVEEIKANPRARSAKLRVVEK